MDDRVPVREAAAAVKGGVSAAIAHDSAHKHVSGEAVYIDDIPEPPGTLQLYAAQSDRAHARILKLELGRVRAAPGVVLVLTAADIPGVNDVSPIGKHDDPVFATDKVEFAGQVLFAVAAETIDAARAAAKLAAIEYEDLTPILTAGDALAKQSFVLDSYEMRRGDAASALKAARHRLGGRIDIGGQDHFYLEGQVSLAIPMEDGDVLVHCSTQHPSEVQHLIAHALDRPSNAVTVEVRRMVFQHFSLFEALTVAENIALGINDPAQRRDLKKRIVEVSQSYGLPLDPDRAVHDLSVGERQRIEIVRCLLQNPQLLIMRSVRPDGKIKIVWINGWYDPGKESDATKALIDQGADIIAQHTDSGAPLQVAQDRGVHGFGQASDMIGLAPKAQLTSSIDNWGPYYVERVKAAIDGTWKSGDVWGGLKADMLKMAAYTNMTLVCFCG